MVSMPHGHRTLYLGHLELCVPSSYDQYHRLRCTISMGGAGPSPCMRHPPAPPPPPRVLRDSGVGAMAPTAPKVFCACFRFIKPSMF